MKHVHQVRITPNSTLAEILDQMADVGVLGAGALGNAYRLLKEILQDPSYTVMLSLSGPLVASGLRSIIAQLIEEKRIHVVITSGANIVHDIIEALGFHHLQGRFDFDDEHSAHDNTSRIGNIFMDSSDGGKI